MEENQVFVSCRKHTVPSKMKKDGGKIGSDFLSFLTVKQTVVEF